MIKRTFDIICAALGLVLLSPVMALIAVWIKSDTAGEVFFRQERVGRFGRIFRIHKFRTMVSGAAARGPAVTAAYDLRITPAGKFLRQHKLDELPQLIDVLAGDMSLVGPRPEVPEFVAMYPSQVREEVLSVRPGITDETSVRLRDESALLADVVDPRKFYIETLLPLKLASYVDYVRTRSFGRDCLILARTARAIIKG
jgi:lipopolysaccharide/colanic/teichoic acid biosynthesis glycosyltransferase